MARLPKLTFDRGTLLLHPPPRGKGWIEFATWDDRVERFRVPARCYRSLVERLRDEGVEFDDAAAGFSPLELRSQGHMTPYPHQREALDAWKRAGRQGVVVLPTAAGKTYLAQLAIEATPRTTLVVVPTLDLMHQWYAHLEAAFPNVEVGLLGGGARDESPILVATYDSAAIHAERWGANYATIVFDECHHLPGDFNRTIAEYAIAPYRLGLTATPERADGRHADLDELIGPEVYRKTPEELSGLALADHEVVQISVSLSDDERDRYDAAIQLRNEFLRSHRLSFGSLHGWQRFIQLSARSPEGRRAMLAHHDAKAIALGTDAKLRILDELLERHANAKTLIFTNDNATVYRISQDFLIPAITHQTPVKERHEILTQFKDGTYRAIVVANVLDEGVDVPDASIAIFLAGSGSTRQFVQRLGRILRKGDRADKRAVLYEVVAADTVEERTSDRRRGRHGPGDRGGSEAPGPVVPIRPGVKDPRRPSPKSPRPSRFTAAESSDSAYGPPRSPREEMLPPSDPD